MSWDDVQIQTFVSRRVLCKEIICMVLDTISVIMSGVVKGAVFFGGGGLTTQFVFLFLSIGECPFLVRLNAALPSTAIANSRTNSRA